MNDTREKGKIIDVFRGNEDHGILTINIGVAFEGGSHQGFGNICLDDEEMADDFVADLCTVFDVKKLKELVGKKCYALRCFDDFDANIEGLESVSGARFTIWDWRKKHFPKEAKSPLELRTRSLQQRIASAKRQIREAESDLADLKSHYHEWKEVRI